MNWNNEAVAPKTEKQPRHNTDKRRGRRGMREQAHQTRIEFPATLSVSSVLDILNGGAYSLD